MKVNPDQNIENFLTEKFKDTNLSFKCYSHLPDEAQDIWTHKVVELYEKNQPVGYIKLMFYDRTQVKCPIDNVLDYFAIVKSGKNPEAWTEQKDLDFFNQFKFLNPVEEIKNNYLREYKEFVSLWDNKPTVEIVRVYSETDKNSVKHDNFPSTLEEREPKNFKNKGLGKTLYLAAALWMKEEKKSVYSSIKQTQDGQNMWKSIQKNPHFILSCETIAKTLNGKPVEIIRNSISVK
jgi:hypothetical protein